MAELKYSPITHDHKAFVEKASKRRGFKQAYDALELEYTVASQMLKARPQGYPPQGHGRDERPHSRFDEGSTTSVRLALED